MAIGAWADHLGVGLLRAPDFRRFWGAQVVSELGSGVTALAAGSAAIAESSLVLLLAPAGAGGPYVLAAAQALFGVGMTTFSVTQISLRQALTPPRLLGRVNATRRLLVFGIQPIGALAGGALGEWSGLYAALVAAAALQLAGLLMTVASPLRSAREASSAAAAAEGGQ